MGNRNNGRILTFVALAAVVVWIVMVWLVTAYNLGAGG